MLTIHLNKNQLDELKQYLHEELNIQHITMDVSEVKVSGHIESKV